MFLGTVGDVLCGPEIKTTSVMSHMLIISKLFKEKHVSCSKLMYFKYAEVATFNDVLG